MLGTIKKKIDAVRGHPYRQDYEAARQFAANKILEGRQFIKDKLVQAGHLGARGIDGSVQKIYDGMAHFNRVLVEGNYQSESTSPLLQILRPKKPDLPETVSAAAASGLVGTSIKIANKMMWIGVLAAASQTWLVWAMIGIGIAGMGLIGYQYGRARRMSGDIIEEKNFAGQIVEGTRADLCRLHIAQGKIINLADNFQRASRESTSDTIKRIMDGVSDEVKRVKVVARGDFNAASDRYEFSELCLKLVSADAPEGFATVAEIQALRQAWVQHASNDNLLQDRVRKLEEMVEKLQAGGKGGRSGGRAAAP